MKEGEVAKTRRFSHQMLAQNRKTIAEFCVLLIFTCIVLSQIAPNGAFRRKGAQSSLDGMLLHANMILAETIYLP